jgi:hypothetical protein
MVWMLLTPLDERMASADSSAARLGGRGTVCFCVQGQKRALLNWQSLRALREWNSNKIHDSDPRDKKPPRALEKGANETIKKGQVIPTVSISKLPTITLLFWQCSQLWPIL